MAVRQQGELTGIPLSAIKIKERERSWKTAQAKMREIGLGG